MKRTHLLVLGAPRSGTTLLTAMIGRHSEVAMLNEHFGSAIKDILSKPIAGNKLCIPNHTEIAARRAWWVNGLSPTLFHALHRYGYFRYRPEGQFSIEDYMRWGPLKVIGIVREGTAVISSIMRRGEQPKAVAIYRWRRSIDILTELSERLQEDLFLLTFDQLVTQSETTMQAIADFLDVPFEPGMLEGYAHTPNYSNRKIDPSKATKKKSIDLDVQQEYPDSHAKYERLVARCSSAHLSQPDA